MLDFLFSYCQSGMNTYASNSIVNVTCRQCLVNVDSASTIVVDNSQNFRIRNNHIIFNVCRLVESGAWRKIKIGKMAKRPNLNGFLTMIIVDIAEKFKNAFEFL